MNTSIKRLLKTGFGLIMLVLITLPTMAQDVFYSQHFANPIYNNPAYVGLSKGMRVRVNGRKAWTKVPGDNYWANFSIDIADRNLPGAGGIGLIVNQGSEGNGYFKTTNVGLIPAVRVPLAESAVMQFGIMGGIVSKKVDWSNLVFPDQIDGRWGYIGGSAALLPNDYKVVIPTFAVGTVIQFEGNGMVGNLGGAVHHLFESNQSLYENKEPLKRRYVGHFDMVFEVNDYSRYSTARRNFKINPGVYYQQQAGMQLVSGGLNILFSGVYIGAWYANTFGKESNYADLTLLAGVNVEMTEGSRLKLMYSYDMTVSKYSTFWGPSHEVSLILELDNVFLYRGDNNIRNVNPRTGNSFDCSPF